MHPVGTIRSPRGFAGLRLSIRSEIGHAGKGRREERALRGNWGIHGDRWRGLIVYHSNIHETRGEKAIQKGHDYECFTAERNFS